MYSNVGDRILNTDQSYHGRSPLNMIKLDESSEIVGKEIEKRKGLLLGFKGNSKHFR